ncbi:MAG: SoxR reducing system RseC family protein [Gallionella sp.]
MLETRAVVVQVDGQNAMVRASTGNGCGHCDGRGCGASKLSSLFCSQPRQFKVTNRISAVVGDEVIVTVADGAVIRGIGQVYLIPLILLVVGAMLGSNWSQSPVSSDAYSALGALFGLAAGFVIAKWFASSSTGNRYRPSISRLSQEQL